MCVLVLILGFCVEFRRFASAIPQHLQKSSARILLMLTIAGVGKRLVTARPTAGCGASANTLAELCAKTSLTKAKLSYIPYAFLYF